MATGSTSPDALVQWRIQDGVGHIVLNRSQAANALSTECAAAFARAVAGVAAADIGAVLLSSTGKQFCAGGDINEFEQKLDRMHGLVCEVLDVVHPAMLTLATLPVPVVSAVQGPAGGAGIALALCADFVLASPAMKLRGGYSAIGLSPDLGASYYLTLRVGAARAKLMLMTNRSISAEQCLSWGAVDELHAADALAGAATALTSQLARGARGSLATIKRLCNAATGRTPLLESHLAAERDALLRCADSADAREGIRAFVEKRTPAFPGVRLA